MQGTHEQQQHSIIIYELLSIAMPMKNPMSFAAISRHSTFAETRFERMYWSRFLICAIMMKYLWDKKPTSPSARTMARRSKYRHRHCWRFGQQKRENLYFRISMINRTALYQDFHFRGNSKLPKWFKYCLTVSLSAVLACCEKCW